MRAAEDFGSDRVCSCSCGMTVLTHVTVLSPVPDVANHGTVQIDMDTIETSNLNRQFLFRKRHVGESKAKVAAEAVKRFRPNARIQADQVQHLHWLALQPTTLLQCVSFIRTACNLCFSPS